MLLNDFHFSKKNIILLGSCALVLSLSAMYAFALSAAPVTPAVAALSTSVAQIEMHTTENAIHAQMGAPASVSIPYIGLHTRVELVGVTKDNSIDVPKHPENVGWFTGSVRPGMPGTAIIVGHSGWLHGLPVAFDDLHDLRMGDKVYVTDDTGTTVTFMVDKTRVYARTDALPTVATSSSDTASAHLILITCSGDWNASEHEYSNRLVVFATRVDNSNSNMNLNK